MVKIADCGSVMKNPRLRTNIGSELKFWIKYFSEMRKFCENAKI